MFWSDDHRAQKISGLLIALLALGAYHAWVSMEVVFGYQDCAAAPEASDGVTLIFPLWEVTRIDGPRRYAASKVHKDVPIEGDTAMLSVGMTISIQGRFRASDLTVVEERREIHWLRAWKERLGVAGFAVMAALAPLFFRVREGRIVG